MCTESDTRLVHIGIECCCGREEESPHTHDHEAGLLEYLKKKNKKSHLLWVTFLVFHLLFSLV